MKNNVLIVGASGGIASALIEQYSSDGARVFAVSRAPLSDTIILGMLPIISWPNRTIGTLANLLNSWLNSRLC